MKKNKSKSINKNNKKDEIIENLKNSGGTENQQFMEFFLFLINQF